MNSTDFVDRMNRRERGGTQKCDEEVLDEFRCKRSDGKQWRCTAQALENKTLCARHYYQLKKGAAAATPSTFQPPPKMIKVSTQLNIGSSKIKAQAAVDSMDYYYLERHFGHGKGQPGSKLLNDPARVIVIDSKLVKEASIGNSTIPNGVAKRKGAVEDHLKNQRIDNLRQWESSSALIVMDGALSPTEARVDLEKPEQSKLRRMCHQCQKNDKGEVI
eukprot:c35464_g1_i1 orf=283-936(+)